MLFKTVFSFFFLALSVSVTFAQLDSSKLEFRQFKYEDGKVSSEGYFYEGRPTGKWVSYFPTGIKKSEGFRKGDRLEGEWIFYNDSGAVQTKINYVDGKKSGWSYIFSKEGFLQEMAWYRDDQRDSITLKYFENQKLRQYQFYRNGLLEGWEYTYDVNSGMVTTMVEYQKGYVRQRENINRVDSRGQKQGLWRTFYPETYLIKMEGAYVDGKKHGYWKEYSTKGLTLNTWKYEMGELVVDAEELENLEVRTKYHPNGKLAAVLTFKDGNAQGIHRFYDEQGAMKEALIYENGVLMAKGFMDTEGRREGPWLEYYPDGKLRAEGAYKKGMRTGEWLFYYPDGKIEQKGSYLEGELANGVWKWFYPSGSIRREETFRRGREDGLFVEYADTSGHELAKGEYLDGLKEGEWMYFVNDHREVGKYEAGMKSGEWRHYYVDTDELRFKGEFLNGLAEGKHQFYYPNGAKMLEGKYSGGEKDGVWKRYNSDGSELLRITYNRGKEERIDGLKLKE